MRRKPIGVLWIVLAGVASGVWSAGSLRDGLTQRFELRASDGSMKVEMLLVTKWSDDRIAQLMLLRSDDIGRLSLSRLYVPKTGRSTRSFEDPATAWRAVLTEQSALLFPSPEETARPDLVGRQMAKGPKPVTRTLLLPGENPLALASTTFDSDDAVGARFAQEAATTSLQSRLAEKAPPGLLSQTSLLLSLLRNHAVGVPALLDFAPLVTALHGVLAAARTADSGWQRYGEIRWTIEGRGTHRGADLSADELEFAKDFGLRDAQRPLEPLLAAPPQDQSQ